MRIGFLQPGHMPEAFQAEHGDYPELYQRLLGPVGLTLETWPVVDGVFPASVHDAPGWLIGGSRHGAYDDLPWIPRLEDFIREAYAARVPLVGICFGHQIIAQALGGTVEKFPGGWAAGPQTYSREGGPVVLNAWHQDQVTAPPPDATLVATSPFCANAAFRYGDRVYSVQPHPEFDAAILGTLIDTRGRGLVPDPILDAAKAQAGTPIDDARIAREIADFFAMERAA